MAELEAEGMAYLPAIDTGRRDLAAKTAAA